MRLALLAALSLFTHAAVAGGAVPSYSPGFWNASNRVYYNNCYNYATNKATNTFAQPGRAYFGYNPINQNTLTCAEVTNFAALDGQVQLKNGQPTLVYIGSSQFCSADKPARMALVMAPGYDYHWYRVDSGTGNAWSHKAGQTIARNWDDSGQPIYDVVTANRGIYTEVCGYFCANSRTNAQNEGELTIN